MLARQIFLQINGKKTDNLIEKWVKVLNSHVTKEDIHCQINIDHIRRLQIAHKTHTTVPPWAHQNSYKEGQNMPHVGEALEQPDLSYARERKGSRVEQHS